MNETRVHIEAFDYYYGLGETRSLGKVAEKFGRGNATIKRWSSVFEWRDHVQRRDRELGEQIVARTNGEILEAHDMNREIAGKLIQGLLQQVNAGQIRLSSIADWKRVVEVQLLIRQMMDGREDHDNLKSLAAILEESALVIRRNDSEVRQDEYH